MPALIHIIAFVLIVTLIFLAVGATKTNKKILGGDHPIRREISDLEYKIIQQTKGRGWGDATTINEEVDTCIQIIKSVWSMPPNIIVDVGANKGLYVKEVLAECPTIEAYLFEPSPLNASTLKKLYKNRPNVHLNNFALSNIEGKQLLYSNAPGSALASLAKRVVAHHGHSFNHSEVIKTRRFDEYWKTTGNIDVIDYVKIDVEGFELNVLKGFGDLIKNVRLVQFEFGETNIDSRTFFRDFWQFFTENNNFKIYRMTPYGVRQIKNYNSREEYFVITTYIAVNQDLI